MIHNWRCRNHIFEIGVRPLIMGIVNVTPDSFSDGGKHDTIELAVKHAMKLVDDGADILDIGGESSRPGALPVSLEEERQRVIPVVSELVKLTQTPLSIDTVKAQIACEALERGACIINDITALHGDARMAQIVRDFQAGLIMMHMQGTPATMQANPFYNDVVLDIGAFFDERLQFARTYGIDEASISLDPGIGFGKSFEDTIQQLRRLGDYQRFNRPICLGVSRKGFIGMITGRPRLERTTGSVAVACHAVLNRSAQVIRVHDVAEHRDAMRVLEAISEPA